MKKYFLTIVAALAVLISCTNQETFSGTLENEADSISYAIGISVGNSLSQDNTIDIINEQALAKALKDLKEESEDVWSAQEAQVYIQKYMLSKQEQRGADNLQKAEEFLAENLGKEGVRLIIEGLQIRTINEGTGASPTAEDKVKVHYRGTLINGDQFDSSYERNDPITFPLNGVIKGWTTGLQEMKVGGKYELFIHPDLGYGARGSRSIGPNELLIFEIELLEINPTE